ncbi:hypothetical protein HJG60_009428 [Phyllostomus discolor]|uniref:Secreted protein n=1 Tax=Phyllostomus discolor TaxID=89673 RepID=A0A833YBY3_9CHIR|nr:hypothetical protein HJG60_009428 [Phyllostomus discolor]
MVPSTPVPSALPVKLVILVLPSCRCPCGACVSLCAGPFPWDAASAGFHSQMLWGPPSLHPRPALGSQVWGRDPLLPGTGGGEPLWLRHPSQFLTATSVGQDLPASCPPPPISQSWLLLLCGHRTSVWPAGWWLSGQLLCHWPKL